MSLAFNFVTSFNNAKSYIEEITILPSFAAFVMHMNYLLIACIYSRKWYRVHFELDFILLSSYRSLTSWLFFWMYLLFYALIAMNSKHCIFSCSCVIMGSYTSFRFYQSFFFNNHVFSCSYAFSCKNLGTLLEKWTCVCFFSYILFKIFRKIPIIARGSLKLDFWSRGSGRRFSWLIGFS